MPQSLSWPTPQSALLNPSVAQFVTFNIILTAFTELIFDAERRRARARKRFKQLECGFLELNWSGLVEAPESR